MISNTIWLLVITIILEHPLSDEAYIWRGVLVLAFAIPELQVLSPVIIKLFPALSLVTAYTVYIIQDSLVFM